MLTNVETTCPLVMSDAFFNDSFDNCISRLGELCWKQLVGIYCSVSDAKLISEIKQF